MPVRSLSAISSRRDDVVTLADWLEMKAVLDPDGSAAKEDLVRALVRDGTLKKEVEYRAIAGDVFNEIEDRKAAIAAGPTTPVYATYPFELNGDLLKFTADLADPAYAGAVYLYMLAVTRSSMESETRTLAGVDPTLHFEDVCEASLLRFWGGRDSNGDIFLLGTSGGRRTRFSLRITKLCKGLGEGTRWNKKAKSPGAGDGGVDLVVWRRFQDKRAGGLVAFAQCKTGDGWANHLGRKNPNSFHTKYFHTHMVSDPMAIYMVPCRVPRDEWDNVIREHNKGLIFDRCRIVQYATDVKAATLRRCRLWLDAAIARDKTFVPPVVAAPVAAAPAAPVAAPP